jgi:hypothetical protein
MDNYDLLSITIENEFLKNVIRWPSQGLFQAICISVRRPFTNLQYIQLTVHVDAAVGVTIYQKNPNFRNIYIR